MIKEEKNNRYIYIVLTQTGTLISNICRRVTSDEYNHASITTDPTLETMYSFGRLWASNPFLAGFVKEGKSKGTFRRFKDTTCYVMRLRVTQEQFDKLEAEIRSLYKRRHLYLYNFPGLVAAGIKVKIRVWHCYYCSEYVYKVLGDSGIDIGPVPRIMKPICLKDIPHEFVYSGPLSAYRPLDE